ncbi:Malate dehydrogenase 2, partial [Durusdinium trenchii]
DSSTHMWSSSTLLLYLKFLSIELRRKRLQLKLKFEDRALIMMDRAAVHSCTTFKKAAGEHVEHRMMVFTSGFMHYVGVGFAVPLDKEEALTCAKLDVEASLRADCWALQKLAEYQDGKLITFAWVSRGMTSLEDLASWRFDGDIAAADAFLQRTPGAMQSLLQLDDIPTEIDKSTSIDVELAESTLLQGEKTSQWCIQGSEDSSPVIPLPDWFKPAIDRTIMIWQKEDRLWQQRWNKRQAAGKTDLAPKQAQDYELWLSTWTRRIILDKHRKGQVLNFEKKNLSQLRSHCLVLEIQLAKDAANLKIRSGNGSYYQLKLLQLTAAATDIPAEVDFFMDNVVEHGISV